MKKHGDHFCLITKNEEAGSGELNLLGFLRFYVKDNEHIPSSQLQQVVVNLK